MGNRRQVRAWNIQFVYTKEFIRSWVHASLTVLGFHNRQIINLTTYGDWIRDRNAHKAQHRAAGVFNLNDPRTEDELQNAPKGNIKGKGFHTQEYPEDGNGALLCNECKGKSYPKDFLINGDENSKKLNENKTLFEKIENVRKIAGFKMGMGDVTGKVLPKFALLSSVNKGGNIRSRYFTPFSCHETHAVTGTLCVASSCLIPGTISYNLFKCKKDKKVSIIVEHPMGEIECVINLENNFQKNLKNKKNLINSCGIYRTARKIMKGFVYVPKR